LNKISVALVEDDRLLREELTYFLSARGFIVHPVGSGYALDELLMTEAIDIYIIDLNLPGEGGLSICNRLRRTVPELGPAGRDLRGGRGSAVEQARFGGSGGAPAPKVQDRSGA
jgi:CheY-like chemotaxis protein